MDYLHQIYTKIFGSEASEQNSYNLGSPRKIIAFGNVLLDHTAQLKDTSLLERFQLSLHSKGELDGETLNEITAEAGDSLSPGVSPGGCALNTVRILKHLGTDAIFFGAIGDDEYADTLKKILHDIGVDARLEVVSDTPTGQAICLVYEDSTALYANIGASAKFSVDYLMSVQRNQSQNFLRPIERRQVLYIESFFIPHREEVCKFILNSYIHGRRRLALNLSGTYVIKEKFEHLLPLARNAFFLFGNDQEFAALMDQLSCNSVEEMVREIMQSDSPKIIIITKGGNGLQLISNYVDEYTEAGEITYQCFNAPRVETVVDTTGAGDAFVAGFLHAWLERRPLTECVRVGMDVAARVVTQIGCNLPKQC